MRFDRGEIATCDGQYKPSKKELKETVARFEKTLAGYKKDMKNLSVMMGRYHYNHNNMRELIGECFIGMSNAKADLKQAKKRLKNFQ